MEERLESMLRRGLAAKLEGNEEKAAAIAIDAAILFANLFERAVLALEEIAGSK